MKTVAAISFRDNHSLSMDVEGVCGIDMGRPMQMDDGTWFCDMLIRTDHGTIAVQMLADAPEKLTVTPSFPE